MKIQKVSQRRLFLLGFLISICLLIGYQVGYGQDMQGKWIATVSSGIGKHDKRLFDYSEKEMLLEMQPEQWGTYHFNMNVKRRVWHQNNFHSYIGLGLGYENATFMRPFNQSFILKGNSDHILLALNKYQKLHSSQSFLTSYKLNHMWYVSSELVMQLLLYRTIDHTEYSRKIFPLSESTFELASIQLSLGISYQVKNWVVSLSSIVVNSQKIDKIIFNDIINDPRTDKSWELHNPLRFDLTVGYMW